MVGDKETSALVIWPRYMVISMRCLPVVFRPRGGGPICRREWYSTRRLIKIWSRLSTDAAAASTEDAECVVEVTGLRKQLMKGLID
jgi:hypothetical protein